MALKPHCMSLYQTPHDQNHLQILQSSVRTRNQWARYSVSLVTRFSRTLSSFFRIMFGCSCLPVLLDTRSTRPSKKGNHRRLHIIRSRRSAHPLLVLPTKGILCGFVPKNVRSEPEVVWPRLHEVAWASCWSIVFSCLNPRSCCRKIFLRTLLIKINREV